MYEVIYTGQFKKSLKLCVRRGLDIQAFMDVLDILQEKGELPPQVEVDISRYGHACGLVLISLISIAPTVAGYTL